MHIYEHTRCLFNHQLPSSSSTTCYLGSLQKIEQYRFWHESKGAFIKSWTTKFRIRDHSLDLQPCPLHDLLDCALRLVNVSSISVHWSKRDSIYLSMDWKERLKSSSCNVLKLEGAGWQPAAASQPRPTRPQEVLLLCAGNIMDVETELFIGPPHEGRPPQNW